MDKLNALSTAEKAIVGGGVLMLIASVLNWWSVSELGISFGESGWGRPAALWSILAILLSLGMSGIIVATRLGSVQMPALPQGVTWDKVWGGGSAALVLLMLLKAWRITDVPIGGFAIGFYLGVIATAAIAYGGYTLYQETKGKG